MRNANDFGNGGNTHNFQALMGTLMLIKTLNSTLHQQPAAAYDEKGGQISSAIVPLSSYGITYLASAPTPTLVLCTPTPPAGVSAHVQRS